MIVSHLAMVASSNNDSVVQSCLATQLHKLIINGLKVAVSQHSSPSVEVEVLVLPVVFYHRTQAKFIGDQVICLSIWFHRGSVGVVDQSRGEIYRARNLINSGLHTYCRERQVRTKQKR